VDRLPRCDDLRVVGGEPWFVAEAGAGFAGGVDGAVGDHDRGEEAERSAGGRGVRVEEGPGGGIEGDQVA
jgi:hypothetical protein